MSCAPTSGSDERNGSFFAAGLTYYTIFALFPLLMVGFALVGFVLSRQPELLSTIDEPHPILRCPADLGQQLVKLMDSAIDARTSVGVIGLVTAAWAGLGWMSHLREALSEMWGQPVDPAGFRAHEAVRSGWRWWARSLVILVTVALSALGHARADGGAC